MKKLDPKATRHALEESSRRARSGFALLLAAFAVSSVVACGGSPARTAPPPEYERPEVPPWEPPMEEPPADTPPPVETPAPDQPESEPPRDPDAPATEPPPAPPHVQDPPPTAT